MKRFAQRALTVAACAALSACISDGPLVPGTPRTFTLSADVVFAVDPGTEVLSSLKRARLTLYDAGADTALAVVERTLESVSLREDYDLTLQVLEGVSLDVRVDVEVIDDGDEVAFTGRATQRIPAAGGSITARVVLGRGPFANLLITSLVVTPHGGVNVQEGATRVLQLDTVGAAEGQIVFFQSSDPDVATVDATGTVHALTPGNALVIANAGRVADSLSLSVGEVVLPSAGELGAWLGPQIDYVTSDLFLNTLSDGSGAHGIGVAVRGMFDEMLAGHGFESVGRFENAEALWMGYGSDADMRRADGPQLGVVALTLTLAADVLGIDFLR